MWGSGVVKLRSGDETWRDLTALRYHFETQPLPTSLGWYAHQLPDSALRLATAVMFAIELCVPFFIFTTRRLRAVAAALFVLLMLVIALTGNYTFFNLLGVALALLLVDDAMWPSSWRRRLLGGAHPRRRWPLPLLLPAAGLIALLSLVPALGLFRLGPAGLLLPYRVFAPYHLTGSYGLFAVMTRSRPEIVIEGSDDGVTWLPYEFRYKPGDLRRRPGLVAPHQPRLDWQMWFAALGDYRQNPWLVRLCARLIEGEPRVLALLAVNPFAAAPPRWVRAEVYDYHFTDFATRRATGAWWRRERIGEYLPAIGRREER
jgi:hypothetical protein